MPPSSPPPPPPHPHHRTHTTTQVNYREGISRAAEVRYVHKKQSGGSGQFADIAVRFAPGEPGTGFEFRSDIKGGVVPKEYIPGVTKVRAGVLGGCGVWCVWAVGLLPACRGQRAVTRRPLFPSAPPSPPFLTPCVARPLPPSPLQGLEEMMSAGSLAGFPVVDVSCTLYDGSYHDVDSSVLAFQVGAGGAGWG